MQLIEVSRLQPEGSGGASFMHVSPLLPLIMQRMNAPLHRSTAAAEGHEYPAPLRQHVAEALSPEPDDEPLPLGADAGWLEPSMTSSPRSTTSSAFPNVSSADGAGGALRAGSGGGWVTVTAGAAGAVAEGTDGAVTGRAGSGGFGVQPVVQMASDFAQRCLHGAPAIGPH